MAKFSHARDLRKGRHSEAGRIYLITTVTADRAPIFGALAAARGLIRVLMNTESRGQARTLAFVVMPDHLHWLMELGEGQDLSQVVGAVKSVSARGVAGKPIWQAGYHDHAVRRGEDLPALARYIVCNPLRAGIAERVGNYPHWDALWL